MDDEDPRTATLYVRLKPEVYEAIKERAAADRRSVQAWMEILLEEVLARDSAHDDDNTKRRKR